ncbi:MAG: response regulator [Rhodocyclaceae bacterium]|nr:response regulator [Rhodocyclaceae bacterium]
MRVLLVEDDAGLAAAMTEALEAQNFGVDRIARLDPAIISARSGDYSLLVVDLGLPDGNGLDLVRAVRGRRIGTPVLIVTARDGLADRVRGLDEGADDYLVKPFDLAEFMARVRALVRRDNALRAARLSMGVLEIDLQRQDARLRGEPLDLTPSEWRLLRTLAMAAPGILSKDALVAAMGTWEREITGNAIEIYVSRLRAKLGEDGRMIRTVRGLGYRLEDDDADA